MDETEATNSTTESNRNIEELGVVYTSDGTRIFNFQNVLVDNEGEENFLIPHNTLIC